MFVYSIYNHQLKVDDFFCYFNSYTCQYFISKDINLQKTNINSLDKRLFSFLEKNGFVVDSKENEIEKTILNADEYMNHSTKLHLTICPTMSCNLRCIYCFEQYPINQSTDKLLNSIFSILKSRKVSILEIEWFGGEPFLDIKKLLYLNSILQDYCNKN